MVSPDVILETSHIFIAIIQHLFSTRIRRVDFKCLIFPEPRHVSDALLWSERGEEKNGAFFFFFVLALFFFFVLASPRNAPS